MKGRRFPSGDVQKQYWKNWSTRDDLRSLAQWEELFGANFRGLFVFAYDVLGDRSPLPAEELFECRGSLYGFIAVPLAEYAAHARPISPRWDTWAMPADDFRRFARPLADLLGLSQQRRCAGSSGVARALRHQFWGESGCDRLTTAPLSAKMGGVVAATLFSNKA